MATFLHRITKEIRSDDGTGFAREDEIRNPDLSLVISLPVWQWVIEGNLVRPPTDEELSILELQELASRKLRRMAEIDERTSRIVTSGCEIEPGKVVATTLTATQNLQNLVLGYQLATVELPQDISMLDGGVYTITNATVLLQVAALVTAQQRNALNSGRALRLAIKSATTLETLNAIVDSREIPVWLPAT